ncbi:MULTISPECIES: hypothetical protein [unclassified Caballeronia]|uniref:hypothetical protein n=1 Tax=unclassified Caballeronia TaxID=2646786 RepID=UPI0020286BBE|nr:MULTISPECIES: hypothetical protein [unclassified Caballeronia]
MFRHDETDFLSRLIAPILPQLKRIAAASRGECSLDELTAEAWIAARVWSEEHGADVPPEDLSLQESVLRGLWQRFGLFANRTMRSAFRLDHDNTGQDGEHLMNSVAAALSAPEAHEPEKMLERVQDELRNEHLLSARFTEAVAWLRTLEHFDHDLPSIADFLSISSRTLKRRITDAEVCAQRQPSMFDGITVIPDDFRPIPVFLRARSLPRTMRRICERARPWQRHLFLLAGQLFNR